MKQGDLHILQITKVCNFLNALSVSNYYLGSGEMLTDPQIISDLLSSSVGICKEIYLITVGLTEANVATVLAGWLSK